MYYQIYLSIGEREPVLVRTCESFISACEHSLSVMKTLDYARVLSYTFRIYSVCLDTPLSTTSLVFSYEK